MGRIGLSVFNQNIIYAVVDNQNRRPKKKEVKVELKKEVFKNLTKEEFLKIDNSKLNSFLTTNNFEKIRCQINQRFSFKRRN